MFCVAIPTFTLNVRRLENPDQRFRFGSLLQAREFFKRVNVRNTVRAF